ncbi:hydrolase [Streptomyces pyxinae]|uniref:hydrolase n=1 Tax=Streptomyces pyxinae TaxID=2970734 RepID=UPI002867CDA7|nr:hydrolase [Streptomyces sp. LP05-1]
MTPAAGPGAAGHPLPGWLPAALRSVRYDGARHPGSPAVAARPGAEYGANCQLYAAAVLARHGLGLPALRSAELWADTGATHRVPAASPLDVLFFGPTEDAWGAHLGIWVGDDRILHLCKEVGHPAVWTPADFARRERYRVLIGVKRVLPAPGSPAPACHAPGARQARPGPAVSGARETGPEPVPPGAGPG